MKKEKIKINLKANTRVTKPCGEMQDFLIEPCEIEIINPPGKNKFWSTCIISLFSAVVGFVLGIGGQLFVENWKETRLIPQLNAKYILERIRVPEEKYVELVKGSTAFLKPEEDRLARSSFRHLIIIKNNSETARATNVRLTITVSPPSRIYAIASEDCKPNPLCGGNSTEILIALKDLDNKREVLILLGIAFPRTETSSLERIGTISILLESENKGHFHDILPLFYRMP